MFISNISWSLLDARRAYVSSKGDQVYLGPVDPRSLVALPIKICEICSVSVSLKTEFDNRFQETMAAMNGCNIWENKPFRAAAMNGKVKTN